MAVTLAERAVVASQRSPNEAASWGHGIYLAVWRWHFYAGLLCLPFLVLLATTGGIYLFKAEIDSTLLAYRTTVTPQPSGTMGADRLIYVAQQAVPDGVPLSFTDPETPSHAAIVTLRDGERKVQVFLNPYDGDVLAEMDMDREAMMVVRRLHSLAFFGPVANALIEIVAGATIILVVTGIYLWWPRRQNGGVVTVRATPQKRVWWRDIHAVTGIFAAAGILFLAATGLPWSIWWGQELRSLSNQAGLGEPRALWADRPVSNIPMQEMVTTAGWALEDTPVPQSLPPSGGAGGTPIGIDRAREILETLGMPAGYEISLPVGEKGVYAAAAYPSAVGGQRMISLDQYTGKPLVDVHFGDLGPVARLIQYGIAIHKGEQWGRPNQLVMLGFCLAIILMAVSAAVMWWKRRPAGRLAAPPWPRDRRIAATVTVMILGLGALFPLTGLAILGLLVIDLAFARLRRQQAA